MSEFQPAAEPGATWDELFQAAREAQADRLYAIAFTPRSGSTRLAQILENSGVLGNPREWFNPSLRRTQVIRSASHNLREYYRFIKTTHRTRRVFGVELTWAHLRQLQAAGEPQLLADVPHWFFLRRRDFLAQSVSLARARASGHYHSIQQGHAPVPEYSPQLILRCLLEIQQQEFALQKYFNAAQISPTELWYEDLSVSEPLALVHQFCDVLQLHPKVVAKVDAEALESRHRKLAGAQSKACGERFADEHADVLAWWQTHRGTRGRGKFFKAFPQYRSWYETADD